MNPSDWPSLAYQIGLADRLFGAAGGPRLSAWLDEQCERIANPVFARLFCDHFNLPGIAPSDFNHRLIHSSRGRLLGGIRFFGGDKGRPFVEVVAHDFEDEKALWDCIAEEWKAFTPLQARIPLACEVPLPPGAFVDVTVFAGRCRDMPLPDGRVSLIPFENVEDAVFMVAAKYADVAKVHPALARNISATNATELRQLHATERLRAICAEVDGREQTVGLFAVDAGSIAWIVGDEVIEEVVVSAYNGRGFAASAQKAWAHLPHREADRLLIGTIDRLNAVSGRTAIRAGRSAVLNYVFVPLGK